jgi:hypothetical protein
MVLHCYGACADACACSAAWCWRYNFLCCCSSSYARVYTGLPCSCGRNGPDAVNAGCRITGVGVDAGTDVELAELIGTELQCRLQNVGVRNYRCRCRCMCRYGTGVCARNMELEIHGMWEVGAECKVYVQIQSVGVGVQV